jgi:cation:H+ antiporter
MTVSILLLCLGLAMIVKGGDLFVGAAVRIAGFLRMPRVVIGSTLVSLATTTPELVVSAMSGGKGASDLAVGNAVGSCVCNIGLVLGLTAIIGRVEAHPRAVRVPLIVLGLCAVGLFVLTLDLSLSRSQGFLLLGAGVAYFIWDFARHARARRPEDIAEAGEIESQRADARWAWFRTKPGTAVQFVLAAGIVALGARWLVDSAVAIAAALGASSMVIGLTVVALGTSLPELVTAVTSARRQVSDLAVGNILGANIANLTLVVGLAASISAVRLDRAGQAVNFLALALFLGAFAWFVWRRGGIPRRGGIVLLGLYALFVAGVVIMATAAR